MRDKLLFGVYRDFDVLVANYDTRTKVIEVTLFCLFNSCFIDCCLLLSRILEKRVRLFSPFISVMNDIEKQCLGFHKINVLLTQISQPKG